MMVRLDLFDFKLYLACIYFDNNLHLRENKPL
jgi:hypothetical protein